MRYSLLVVVSVISCFCRPIQAATPSAPTAAAWVVAAGTNIDNAASFSVTASPTSAVADAATAVSLVVVLQDSQGNPIAQAPVSLAVSGAANRLGVASGTTDNLGRFGTTLKSSEAGTKIVTATVKNRAAYASVVFTAGAPEAKQSLLTIAPGTAQVADGITPFVLTATLRDTYGNPVSGYTLTPTSDSPGASFTPASGNTGYDGRFVASMTATQVARHKVSLVVGTGSLAALASFYGSSPNAALSGFTLTPNSTLQSDGNDAFTARVTLRDSFNNPVNSFPVTLSSDTLSLVFTPSQGVTNSTGVFASTVKSKYVGQTSIHWAAGPLSGGNTITFVVGQPKNTTSTITAAPVATVADGNAQAIITGTVRDASGNPVPGEALTFTMTGSNNVISNSNCVSDANGSCVIVVSSTRAESKNAYLTAGTFIAKGVVDFVPGPATTSSSAISANSNATLVADGSSAFLLSVRLADAHSNPVGSAPMTMSSAIAADIFKPVSGKTNAAGIFTTQFSARTIGARGITATSPTLAQQANFSFGLGPMSLAASTLVATPKTALLADGVTTTTLTAQIRDAQGRPLPGLALILDATGFDNQFSTSAPITDGNGALTATFMSTRAETKKVTLKSGNSIISTQVTFVAGSPNQSVSTLVSNTAKPIVGITGGAKLQLTVMDAFGNACANVPVTFASTGTANTFAIGGGNTNAYGVLSTTLSSTKAETKTVSGRLGALSVDQAVTFSASQPSPATSTFSASPTSGIIANGTASTSLLATVLDMYSNPVVRQSVYLYINDRNVTTAKRSGLTDADGQFATTMVSTTPGAKSVSLQAGSASKMLVITYSAPPTAGVVLPSSQAMPWDWPSASPSQSSTGGDMLTARTHGISSSRVSPALVVHLARNTGSQWAVAHPKAETLIVYTQNNATDAPQTQRLALHAAPRQLLAGDINGDGHTDLIAASGGSVASWLGQNSGAFEPGRVQSPFDICAPMGDSALTDCDGDGLDDLAVLAADGSEVAIFRSLGDGSFEFDCTVTCVSNEHPAPAPDVFAPQSPLQRCLNPW